MFSALLALCFVCTALAELPPTLRPRRCPGGYEEGQTATLGRYWYECRDGQLEPKGCLNEQGTRVAIGDTYDSGNKNYKMQCVKDSNGYLAFTYKSCMYDGREHAAGETWEDGKYYYTCEREGDYLRVTVAGCMDEGRRVPVNDKVVKGSFVYQCKKSVNGTCSMCPVACKKFGHEYQIGEMFDSEDLVYTCTNTDKAGPIVVKVVGCLNEQKQRLKDGDRFFKDDVVYECTVREAESFVRPVGCVQHDNGQMVERRLGCYWVEGPEPYQYEMTCKADKNDEKKAVKVQHRCSYKLSQGSYTIDPGCYQIADKKAIGCKKEGDQLTLRAVSVDQIGDLTAQGMRFC